MDQCFHLCISFSPTPQGNEHTVLPDLSKSTSKCQRYHSGMTLSYVTATNGTTALPMPFER